MLRLFERLLLIGTIALVVFLYSNQAAENLRLQAQVLRLNVEIKQLRVDMEHLTDPDVIQDRTIKLFLRRTKEEQP